MSEKSIGESKEIAREPRIIDRRSYLKTVGATGGGLAFGGLGLSETGIESARAATTIIDDFEDADLSEYSFDRGSSGASVVSSPAQSGSYALEYTGTNIEAISTSGLNAYPAAGDTFSFWVRASGGADNLNVTWGVQDHQNRYYAKLYPASGDFYLFTYKNGSGSSKDSSTGLSLSQDTWYEIEIDWATDGTQTATLYDGSGTQLAQISMIDTDWSSGGVGYDAYLGSGEYVYFDYVTLGSGDGGSSGGSASPNGPDVSGGGLVVDNFEDGDLKEYGILYEDSDSTDEIKMSESTVYHGSYAVKVEDYGYAYSTSGLENYPAEGSTITCWMRGESGASTSLYYGGRNPDNCHYVSLDYGTDGTVWLATNVNGSWNSYTNKSASIPVDEWIKVTVEWGRAGQHTATVEDTSGNQIVQLSYTDDTYDSGGVGWMLDPDSSGYDCFIDSILITDLDDSGVGVVVDDFEDGDLSEYSFDRGESGASVVSSPTFNGKKALEISGTNTEMIKTTGLPNEPEAGDVFNYWVRGTGGADMVNLTYGVQDHENRYFVRVNVAEDRLKLYRYENGDGYLLEKQVSGFTLNEDRWYKVQVDWRTNGCHVVKLYSNEKQVEIDAIDSTWQNGGIGYDAYVGDSGTVYIDHVVKNQYEICAADCVVDDFEDADLSEYSFTNGNESAATTVARSNGFPTYFGEYSLQISDEDVDAISTGGLPNYPAAGNHFRYYLRPTNGASEVALAYGVQDENNRYRITINFENDDIVLKRQENGTVYELESNRTSSIIGQDDWYRVEVDWRMNGTHTISLYNNSEDRLIRLSASDSTWTEGGVGYEALLSSGGTVYFDSVLLDGYQQRIKQHEQNYGEIQDISRNWFSDSGEKYGEVVHHHQDGTTVITEHYMDGNDRNYSYCDGDKFWVDNKGEKTNQRQRIISCLGGDDE